LTERTDCVVIGAGAVGLAVARSMAMAGYEVVLAEAADAIGTGTSSRNSEVIHAGIYYPTGSMKARLCVAGKQALYDYCARKGVPHRRIGKLIVAVDDGEVDVLESYRKQAAANGVPDLRWVEQAELAALEPAVRAVRGLFSPSTGILDSHAYMLALQGDLEDAGGMVAFQSRVDSVEVTPGGFEIAAGETRVHCRSLINAAGIDAPGLARKIAGLDMTLVPEGWLAKGHYYSLAGSSPFKHLVYPQAGDGGLGVHVTLDMAGGVRFGPDVRWINEPDYAFDDSRREEFIAAIRRYYPGLHEAALQPAYTGIRPKIVGPGEPPADFMIQGPRDHGLAGLVNLFGIESPGLTASLAIGDEVLGMLRG
jgi:L-2-hydroxyglutarate oxidase LhgO